MKTMLSKITWKRVLIAVVIVIIATLAWSGYQAWSILQGMYDGSVLQPIDQPTENEPINVLIMGVDALPGRSDTNIFVSFNPLTNQVLALSLLRDTQVNIPGTWKSTGKPYGVQKLGHAHSYGGIPLAVQTVEEFLNVNIHYYARLDYSVLHEIVDAIGGVPITVPFDMKYDDYAGNLHIDLKAGYQVLDAEQAEEFLRWRKNNDGYGDGDVGRVERQQAFIMSAIDQLVDIQTIFKLNKLEDIVSRSIDTNADPAFMFETFKDIVVGFDFDNNFRMVSNPGKAVGASWVTEGEDLIALRALIQDHMAPNFTEDVLVKVVNGTYEKGLATRVAAELSEYPHIFATADEQMVDSIAVTEVTCYTEDSIGIYVAKIVNAEHNVLRGEADEQQTADIVIVLGRDYRS